MLGGQDVAGADQGAGAVDSIAPLDSTDGDEGVGGARVLLAVIRAFNEAFFKSGNINPGCQERFNLGRSLVGNIFDGQSDCLWDLAVIHTECVDIGGIETQEVVNLDLRVRKRSCRDDRDNGCGRNRGEESLDHDEEPLSSECYAALDEDSNKTEEGIYPLFILFHAT